MELTFKHDRYIRVCIEGCLFFNFQMKSRVIICAQYAQKGYAFGRVRLCICMYMCIMLYHPSWCIAHIYSPRPQAAGSIYVTARFAT